MKDIEAQKKYDRKYRNKRNRTLNDIAKSKGYKSWYSLGTLLINGNLDIVKKNKELS